jgi:1-acyl-sn-glycerol-3-phosphate acyltransferase
MERSFTWKSLQIIARVLTTTLFDLKTYHRENVPASGGVLLVANHQSYLDPVLVAVHLKRPVSFMARSSLFGNRYFGAFLRMLHAFPVRRGEGDIGAMKETLRRLEEGHVMNIYPEGTRTLTGDIKPLEKGVALLIRKAKAAVVPVAIDGSFGAWPKGRRLFHSHPIRVLYGKPMELSGLKADEILRRLEAALKSLLADLRSGNF